MTTLTRFQFLSVLLFRVIFANLSSDYQIRLMVKQRTTGNNGIPHNLLIYQKTDRFCRFVGSGVVPCRLHLRLQHSQSSGGRGDFF